MTLVPAAASAEEAPPLYVASVLYAGGNSAEGRMLLAAAGDTLPAPRWLAAAADSDSMVAAPAAPAPGPTSAPLPPFRQPHPILPLTGGAVFGTGLGIGAAYAGALIADQDASSDDLDALGGAILGFTIGEPLGVALGTHLGNGSKGSFGSDLAIAFLTGLVGGGIAALDGPATIVLGAAVQLGSTLLVERASARHKHEKRAAAAAAGSTR